MIVVKSTKITDIQRFSVHDGPGIRTIIFFKGCPLQCAWCQNPETRKSEPQIAYYASNCIGCMSCVDSCPNNALKFTEAGCLEIDKEKCSTCGNCASNCYPEALKLIGQNYSSEELLEIILNDQVFYKNTYGGVTLSGGEPLLHSDFILDFASKLNQHKIHIAMETCGYSDPETFEKTIKDIDLLLFDIKVLDENAHIRYTGNSNKKIISNLYLAKKLGKQVIIRVPYIKGVNTDGTFLTDLSALAKDAGVNIIHLLPFHQFGKSKWEAMRYDYAFSEMESPSNDEIAFAKNFLENRGFQVDVGGANIYQ